MSAGALLPSSVTYNRKECPDLLEYAKVNRDNGVFNDVTIITEYFYIEANRMVLSYCSTFFEKRFKSKMKRRCTGKSAVEITQIGSSLTKHLIDYMYEGSITINSANVTNVLAAADFLQIAEVKLFCFEFLKGRITSDSWHAVLSTAKLYKCDQLQKHTYQFITEHLDEITQSADFKTITKDDLTSLISTLRENKTVDESIVCKLIIDWIKRRKGQRRAIFAELFQTIRLEKLSLHYLESLFEEALVKSNPTCVNAITVALFNMLKTKKQGSTKNESFTIFSVGGRKAGRKVIEIFSVLKSGKQKYPDFPYAVKSHCSVKFNGIVYCIGGCDPNNTSKIYDKVYQMNLNETNLKWKEVSPLIRKRCMMGAAVFCGCLVVAGGMNDGTVLTSTEYSNEPSSKWKMAPLLQHKRYGNGLVVCNGSLYALGGFNGATCMSSVEQLRSLDSEWLNVASMLTPRERFSVVSVDGCMYAIGGRSSPQHNSALKTVERYDPGLDKWSYVCGMTYKRSFHCACVCDEKVFVIGGLDERGNVVSKIECYDPSKDEWRIVENLKHQLVDFAIFSN